MYFCHTAIETGVLLTSAVLNQFLASFALFSFFWRNLHIGFVLTIDTN